MPLLETPPQLLGPDDFTVPPEYLPNYDRLVEVEGLQPHDLFSLRQTTLLCDSLEASLRRASDRPTFVAMGNVGVFYALTKPPIVPDFLVSFHVEVPSNLLSAENRSYFNWNYGKPPDLVIEFVTDRHGDENGAKRRTYARIGISYYAIYDPQDLLGYGVLQVLSRRGTNYERLSEHMLPELGLGFTLWNGYYAGTHHEWLRFVDREGRLLLTGKELAEQEQQRADTLAAQLRALGIEPTA